MSSVIRGCYIALAVVNVVALLASCTETTVQPIISTSQCTDFENYMHIEGSLDTPGIARRAAAVGDVLYLADGIGGVQVVDLRDPTAPVIAGVLSTGVGVANDVVVDGDRLYVATTTFGIVIFDISDPPHPNTLGGIPAAGQPLGIAVRGDILYVADDQVGLQVINVSNPAFPVAVGGETTPGIAHDLQVTDTHIFVSDQQLGLRSIFMPTPTTPDLSTTLPLSGDIQGLARRGSTLYIAAGGKGLHVVDITNPDNPVHVDSVAIDGGPRDVEVDAAGNLFVADRFLGVRFLTTTDPHHPRVAATIDTPGEVVGVNRAGDYLVVSNASSGFHVIDNSGDFDVPIEGTLDTPGQATGVFVVGDAVYVCDGSAGIQIVRPPDEDAGNLAVAGATHLAVSGDVAYAATGGTVTTIDVRDPFAPTVTDAVAGSPSRLAVGDSVVLLAEGTFGVGIHRVRASGALEFAGRYDPPDLSHVVFDVAARGDLVFLAAGLRGLRVIDVSTPDQPQFVGSRVTSAAAMSVALIDNYAVVAVASRGIQVFDIQTPALPIPVGAYDTNGAASFVAITGDAAFVADETGGMHIFDIGTPAGPILVGTIAAPNRILGATADASFVYAVDEVNGLIVTQTPCGLNVSP
jgi:hypothetical protein